ncbi:MAG: class I SAM-dependent methyltransferase [Opitutales bacterium]
MSKYNWHFNEFVQVGRDYTSIEEVKVYDETHSQFRDIALEANDALDRLGVAPNQVLVDIGSGTGIFSREASKRGMVVHASDVSETMISYAQEQTKGFEIMFHHAGFLTLDLPDASVDFITTTFAFHHLPDYWKGIALKRIWRMLKTGGQLYLRDVIIQEENSFENIEALISHQESLGGDFLRDDAIEHFRDENSTYDWVMDGLIDRASFQVVSKEFAGGLLGTYYCRKREE